MLTYFLSHQIYRYVIYMFIMYSIFKNTPNLNLQNKMITHITLLATIMNYVMDNVSEISKQELSKKKNIEKFKNKKPKKKKKKKPKKKTSSITKSFW